MKLSVLLGAVVLAITTAALVVTNPGPEAYAEYVGTQAQTYLTDEVCTDLPAGIGDLLGNQCGEMVQSLMPQLDSIIRDRTERLNFAIGSIYRTSLGIPDMPMLPEYRVESLGIVNRFFTYYISQAG
jgi:competence protein ComGC